MGGAADFFQNNPLSMFLSPNYAEKQIFGTLPFSTNAFLDKASGKSNSIMGSMGGGSHASAPAAHPMGGAQGPPTKAGSPSPVVQQVPGQQGQNPNIQRILALLGGSGT